MLNIRDRTEVNYFTTIIQSMVQFTEEIANSPNYASPEYTSKFRPAVGQFFLTIENMLSMVDRTEDGFSVALTILQELKRLPVHVMTSMKSWPKLACVFWTCIIRTICNFFRKLDHRLDYCCEVVHFGSVTNIQHTKCLLSTPKKKFVVIDILSRFTEQHPFSKAFKISNGKASCTYIIKTT
jgi:hypothetical protein